MNILFSNNIIIQSDEDTYQLKFFTVCTTSLESFQQTQNIFPKAHFVISNIIILSNLKLLLSSSIVN